jgi:hypothetical protein
MQCAIASPQASIAGLSTLSGTSERLPRWCNKIASSVYLHAFWLARLAEERSRHPACVMRGNGVADVMEPPCHCICLNTDTYGVTREYELPTSSRSENVKLQEFRVDSASHNVKRLAVAKNSHTRVEFKFRCKEWLCGRGLGSGKSSSMATGAGHSCNPLC